MDIFGGSSQNWTIFRGSFLCIIRSFLKVEVQNRGYSLRLLKFQIFWGVPIIPNLFLGVNGRYWAQTYV